MNVKVNATPRREFLTRGNTPGVELAEGVTLQTFATGSKGANGMSTGTAAFRPGASLPYHWHTFSEVLIVLNGKPSILIEGRRYRLDRYDAIHIPAGTVHGVHNGSAKESLIYWSMASDAPTRELVEQQFETIEISTANVGFPESLVRFRDATVYELAPGTEFRDLFARRLGSRGICGGFGRFRPGTGLPCHYHDFDESITIVEGTAQCQVAGRQYELSGNDTACIPTGLPHRFVNRSQASMAMIWVYAGDEPDRVIVDTGFCEVGSANERLGRGGDDGA